MAESTILMERVFPATDDSFLEASAFVESTLEEWDAFPKAAMQISIAFEEIFVNVAHYAYPAGVGDVKISMELTDGVLALSFADSGIPFDPLAKADPDITLSAEDRRIGGLGILMVKKSMDDVLYRYEDNQNILTLVKKITF